MTFLRVFRPAPLVAALAFTSVAVPGTTASAAGDGVGAGRHGGGLFARFDTDGDGRISRAEMESGRAAFRAGLDADGDGAVTEAEMQAAASARFAERVGKRFARLDANGDGRIDASEFAEHDARRFARADADGDGFVTRDEADAAMARLRRMTSE